jgi:hypothetical protein
MAAYGSKIRETTGAWPGPTASPGNSTSTATGAPFLPRGTGDVLKAPPWLLSGTELLMGESGPKLKLILDPQFCGWTTAKYSENEVESRF